MDTNCKLSSWKIYAFFTLFVVFVLSQSDDLCFQENTLRLGGNGVSNLTGMVELCLLGSWRTICSNQFNGSAAKVVCRQLGFSAGSKAVFYSNVGIGENSLDNLICSGREDSIADCSFNLTFINCSEGNVAGVQCEAHGFSCEEGEPRLFGGSDGYRGRLEICMDGSFSSVCDDGWDQEDARVVCQQLNATSRAPVILSGTSFGSEAGVDISLGNFQCTGNEATILSCVHSNLTGRQCNISMVVAMQCSRPCGHGEVVLVGNSPNEGRVEVCVGGVWSTVCHIGWSTFDARVVCRQQGYTSEGAVAVGFADFGPGTGPILVSNVQCNGSESRLVDCSYAPRRSCEHFDDAGVICRDPNNTCVDGAVRLSGGSANGGRLELCYDNHWGTVCDDDFYNANARVVCRLLGYPEQGAVALHRAFFGAGRGIILLDDVQCIGNESSLLDCRHRDVFVHNCHHSEDVSILCQVANSSCANGAVRLAEGWDERSGRVEVCFNGYWGTICDDGWDSHEAAVVCNQLNFNGSATSLSGGFFGAGTGPIFLDNVGCFNSSFSNILECLGDRTSVGRHNCVHAEDAAVVCNARPCNATESGGLRLVGGRTYYEGRVELCLDGTWGTLCDDFWSNNDASVACNQLGFGRTGAVAYQEAEFGPGSGPIWLNNFFCGGTEEKLVYCSSAPPSSCTHDNNAGVSCPEPSCRSGDVRLVGGRYPSEGRVEICISNAFGTICDEGWTNEDAQVICRQLGFSNGTGAVAVPGAFFGRGSQLIHLSEFGCSGAEESWVECSSATYTFLCRHAQDASVLCQSTNASVACKDGAIRLRGGGAPYQGRLEMCYRGHWGTVCQNSWDETDALAVCRILGYGASNLAIPTTLDFFSPIPSPLGPVFVKEVECTGNETNFLDCLVSQPGGETCFHARDAGVFCSVSNATFECQTGEVRLADSLNNAGRVEVCINGRWGTVCDKKWGLEEASIICRQLGFDPTRSSLIAGGEGAGSDVPIYFSNLECMGDEETLIQCQGEGPGAFCRHSQDANVACQEFIIRVCQEGDIRLVGGVVEWEGSVEVCQDNEWGSVCDNSWTVRDAQVACRQLGYTEEGAVNVSHAFFSRTVVAPVLLEGVACAGNESSISNCTSLSLQCTREEDVGVICPSGQPLNCTRGEMRLRGGSRRYEGRVEVCVFGRWGSVCDDFWGQQDAQVVCNYLGYNHSGVAIATIEAEFSDGQGRQIPVLLDDVACTGSESTLTECAASPLGAHNCDFREAAGVYCPVPEKKSECSNGDVRLVNSSSAYDRGKVEFCVGGKWRPICATFLWNNDAAQVVCRQLGYRDPEKAVSITIDDLVSDSRATYGLDFDCEGSERSLAECRPLGMRSINDSTRCLLRLSEAGVVCVGNSDCENGEIRLVDGLLLNEGRVELCYNRDWGTVCDDSWGAEEAKVVCRQLGYPDNVPHIVLHQAFFGQGLTTIHLDDLSCLGTEQSLFNCSRSPIGIHNCAHSEDAGVACTVANSTCMVGDVRLVGGRTNLTGRLEVCLGGRWGTVCRDRWDNKDSAVICGQLGYSRQGSSFTAAFYEPNVVDLYIALDEVRCTGNEENILQCPANVPGLHDCNHFIDVAVTCQPRPEMCNHSSIQLVGGRDSREGVVRVCVGSAWSSVCWEGWGDVDAAVVCRQLNFTSGRGPLSIRGSLFGWMSDSAVVGRVQCRGNETNLLDCPHSRQFVSLCSLGSVAGVICPPAEGAALCSDGSVRLVGGRNQYEGRVEVCYNSSWGGVCDDRWDSRDASVVCNQLNFSGFALALSTSFPSAPGGSGRFLLDDLECSGMEGNLFQCVSGGLGVSDCDMWENAGVTCTFANNTCTNGDVQLVGPDSDASAPVTMGRVELCVGGQWRSVCGVTSWRDQNSRVVCRQLGFNASFSGATTALREGSSSMLPVVVVVARCVGNEKSLTGCPQFYLQDSSSTFCFQKTSVGVVCGVATNCSEGSVRLVGGELPNEGIVEICTINEWGSICDDGWDRPEARVVCRQLGYEDTADSIPYHLAHYGATLTPIHLDDLDCNGTESELLQCSHAGVGVHNCDRSEDAGVLCIANSSVCYHGQLRLVGGATASSGRVELCVGGKWGTVCDDLFDGLEAAVICRQLGYSSEGANATTFGAGEGEIFLDNLECVGNETNLLDCPRPLLGTHNCRHDEDAGVSCFLQPPTLRCSNGDVRLVRGTSSEEGTVELCLSGEWGTVCDNEWDNNDAGVVCRQLGLNATGAIGVRNAFFGSGSGNALVSGAQCNGSELQLVLCSLSYSQVLCSHEEDAGVICPKSSPQNCSSGDIRLQSGQSPYEGRVEVCVHGNWGMVCDDSWDYRDAAVVCRQLNFRGPGEAYAIHRAQLGQGSGLILLDDVDCVGNETALLRCRARALGTHNCASTENAKVFCPYEGSSCPNGALRLQGGNEVSGRVQICLGGQWGSMCATLTWIDTTAAVVCKTLGFNKSLAAEAQFNIANLYGQGSGPILVTTPLCTGLESNIRECTGFEDATPFFCDHTYDAGVVCDQITNATCTSGSVRLVGGASANEGRVEMCASNIWGTVCDDEFDGNDASVVCRQLGYDATRGSIPIYQAFFGEGSGRVLLDELACDGNETNLLECPGNSLGDHNCRHNEDVGVICVVEGGVCELGSLRLNGIDRRSRYEGRVEVCLGDRYGTVCDDQWDNMDASVVCRQLGFNPDGAQPVPHAGFGQGVEGNPIVLDGVMCTGEESSLLRCASSGLGIHNCFHSEDAGVICRPLPCDLDTVRVVGGVRSNTSQNGQVEFCQNGTWVPVCDDSFTSDTAASICSSLGADGSLAIPARGTLFSTPDYSNREDYMALSGSCATRGQCTWTQSSVGMCGGVAGVLCPISVSSAGTGGPSVCETGSMQLVGGSSAREGRLEVCLKDQWGTVCDDSLDKNTATVVCQQLGFSDFVARPVYGSESLESFGTGSGPIWLDDVKCNGTEDTIWSCPQKEFDRNHDCQHREDAGVRCDVDTSSCTPGDVRLVGRPSTGRLEVCWRSRWGSVCSSQFDRLDAAVVCRQLNLPSEGANFTIVGGGSGATALTGLQCAGNETNILDCDRSSTSPQNCSHDQDVGVSCASLIPGRCSNGDIRLVGGASSNEGTVQLCLLSEWGTVCDDEWDNGDAAVVCRKLGLSTTNAIALRGAFFGSGSGEIFVSNVDCQGTERDLQDCVLSYKNNFFCLHREDAGVICPPRGRKNCTDGAVRLQGGRASHYEGTVEVCLHGRWGSVCDDSWTMGDALVVCRQLNYLGNGDPVAVHSSPFGVGSGPIFLDDLLCEGSEMNLLNCRAQEIGVHDCTSLESAAVYCPAKSLSCTNGELRLQGGDDVSGRVEMCLGGRWGTMCSGVDWRDSTAQVVCRTLGFTNTSEALAQTNIGSVYGVGTAPILVTAPLCTGLESKITECRSFNNGFLHLCGTSNIVGVACQKPDGGVCTNGRSRLVGGARENEGRVEVCAMEVWGTICDDNFDETEARVVCRQLGYNPALGSIPVPQAFFGQGYSRIHLNNLDCHGNESSLLECPSNSVGARYCSHAEDVGVICTTADSACANGEVRLKDGRTKYEGRVEVCYGGTFGTVCDDLWDSRDASVVCYQLGFSPDNAEAVIGGRYRGALELPIWLDEVQCVGNETGLASCTSSGTGSHNCQHLEDAGVVCKPLPCDLDTVRVVGGVSSNASQNGQVEFCQNGTWVPVCGDSFTSDTAASVCSSLGADGSLAITARGTLFSTPDYSNREDYVDLSGSCATRGQCTWTQSSVGVCGGVAGVLCPVGMSSADTGGPSVCETGSVQLVGGSSAREGRLEVCLKDQWGTVCDDSLDKNTATVVCQQLGFSDFVAQPVYGSEKSFGTGSGPIWLDDVKCTGTEKNILSCTQLRLDGTNNCQHKEDSGVQCQDSKTIGGDVKPEPQSNTVLGNRVMIPLVVLVAFLIVVVIIVIIIVIIVFAVKSRSKSPHRLKFQNDPDDNLIVESDELGKEHDDLPMEKISEKDSK